MAAQAASGADEAGCQRSQRRHKLGSVLAPLGAAAVPVPGNGNCLGHSVSSMVRARDLSEMEADGVVDAGEQGREVGLQTIERDGDRSVLIGGDQGTRPPERPPAGAVV